MIWSLKKTIIFLIVFLIICFVDYNFPNSKNTAKAATTTFTVTWNVDFQSFAWVQTSCTILATCNSGRVNDAGVSSNVLFANVSALINGAQGGYWKRTLTWQSMGVPANATITQVDGSIQAKLNNESSNATQNINIFMFDSADTTSITNASAAIEPSQDVTPVGSWNTYNTRGNVAILSTYQDYNTSISIRLGENPQAGTGIVPSGEIRLHNLSLIITYELPVLTQSNYRFFDNNNSTDIGTALAAQNTNPTMTSNGQIFRLRQMIGVTTGKLFASQFNFKLQFVDRGTGSCAAPTGGSPSAYTDITSSTSIAYFDNNSVTDGASLTSNANDPSPPSGSVTKFTYEEAGNFTNSSNVIIGDFAMWDFSLYDNTALPGKSFCFRMVKSDGTPLDSYSQYAQINTQVAALSVDFVDALGSSIASPTITFSNLTARSFCQTATGTLGTSGQRIRVKNTTTNPLWTISIAADGANTALWNNGINHYDFNDTTNSGCTDGPDADSYAGLMSLNNSTASMGSQPGCTTTGMGMGSNASFNQGVTDSITLAGSSGTSDTECYWEATNFTITQKVPENTPIGNYSGSFVITILAF